MYVAFPKTPGLACHIIRNGTMTNQTATARSLITAGVVEMITSLIQNRHVVKRVMLFDQLVSNTVTQHATFHEKCVF